MDGPNSERITTREIIDAITSTLANARTEGEPYQSKTEEHLGAMEAILLRIHLEMHDVKDALKQKDDELERLDNDTELVVQTHADEIWTQLGCPDYDPIYTILFPSTTQKESTFQAKAEHLSVVADILSSGMHPKIDRVYAAITARTIREFVATYHELLANRYKLQVRKTSLEAFEASVARIGLLELGKLRRTLRSMGLDDTDIKSVVLPPASIRLMGPKTNRSP
jgi:hypothetical protein